MVNFRKYIARKLFNTALSMDDSVIVDEFDSRKAQTKESPVRESYVSLFRLWRNRRKANRRNRPGWSRWLLIWWSIQYYMGVLFRLTVYVFGIMLAYTIAYMGICVILGVVLGVVNVISA